MAKHGIGTDATHAEHIEKTKSRYFVGVLPDGRFTPGELGMGLVERYENMGLCFGITKPYLRAELESDLKKICLGQKQKEVVLEEQNNLNEYFSILRRTSHRNGVLSFFTTTGLQNQVPVQEWWLGATRDGPAILRMYFVR